MLKYATFDQTIPYSLRRFSIFIKRPQPAEMMLGEASSPFAYQSLDNAKIKSIQKFDPSLRAFLLTDQTRLN